MKKFLKLLLYKIAYQFRFLKDLDFWIAIGVISAVIVFVVGICFGVGSTYKYFDPNMHKNTIKVGLGVIGAIGIIIGMTWVLVHQVLYTFPIWVFNTVKSIWIEANKK